MRFIIILIACLNMWACTTHVETSKPTETPISEQTVAELENGITNKHPSTYIILAKKLFVQGDKQNAVKWFYVGQIRYRAYLMANPELDPSSDPALFASLMSVVGTPLNEYIGGDVDEWVKTIDDAIAWHNNNPDEFLGKETHQEIYTTVISGLTEMKNKIESQKEFIKEQRTKNGLENR
jgi:hypothetical protein